ncbi:HAD-IA family hydrolase [Pasteurella canis]|uniref:HAD-IA family hydrolase n=1 Tax=Pasteurella canis TaxID=753 RepID=UPI000D975669|nr:HAD-IA family hydrolase [Pasteurella canis]SPY32644.1 protein YigB [Pasteurella canis]
MKFYRTLQPFKLISFDLDDTLYDNTEVIRLAEQHFLAQLKQESQLHELTTDIWRDWKNKVAQQNSILSEDVVEWRIESMRQLLAYHQKSAVEMTRILQSVMDVFVEWRHKIEVPNQSQQVLNTLKTKYPLVAITNGNVEPQRIGLTQFDLVLRGGEQGRAKPHQDLFYQTAQQFGVQPQEILHVGDNLIADIQGAIQANCQAVWINQSGKNLRDFSDATLVPTVEITDLTQLLLLSA